MIFFAFFVTATALVLVMHVYVLFNEMVVRI
jgi:hypothetical protein